MPLQKRTEDLKLNANQSLARAINWSFDQQHSDGHWVAECHSNATITAQYIFLRQAFDIDHEEADSFKVWIFSQQKPDGSWGLATNYRGDVSTTTESYLALKILGVSGDEPRMVNARRFVLNHGGCEKVRFFTRFFLASFGLFPWNSVPQLPAEFILAPSWFPINIQSLSYWARATLIPMLCLRYHEPVYALPNGLSRDNNFLDELWCDPANKNVPYAPSLLSILKRREWVQAGFTLLDHIVARTNLAKNSPLNKYARTQCVEWILRHFEQNGHIGGVWPPMHTATWALLEEGYDMKHHIISRSFTAMEDFCISDQNGKRVQPTTSPVWDTVLMQFGLCEIEMLKHDSRLCKAHDWILKMQSPANTLSGDWRIFKPKLCSGGWSFQYHNSWFPDIDDTAVAVMALIKYDVHIVKSDSIVRAITWMLGMQNPDGGWGAFDWNNNKMYLNKIPFNDMNALCDPSTADITGRLLECFGVILSSPKVELIPTSLIQKIDVATNKAIEFVLKSQELNGSWWGRWGCNYIYGSSNVMRGISHLVHNNYQLQLAASKCISWLRNCQNTCGGWGEGYESYDNPELAGKGITTASQTAWAILAMLPYCPPTDTTIRKGIEFLISSQTDFSDHGMSWPVHAMTGTGFPGTFYVGYPLYEHYFPLMALAKFVQAPDPAVPIMLQKCLPSPTVELLNQPDIVLMTIGSHGDITASLEVAKSLQRLFKCRIRFAASPMFEDIVKQQLSKADFYSVGGDPMLMVKYPAENKNTVPSIKAYRQGAWGRIKKMQQEMMDGFWSSSTDTGNTSAMSNCIRPFLADAIMANASVHVHVHCAELLKLPLVLISLQPRWLTSEILHFMAYSHPLINQWKWWKYASHLVIETLVWVLVGSFVNRLRLQNGMRPTPWFTTPARILNMDIPHLGLWSPTIIPRPLDCSSKEKVVGYAFTNNKSSIGLDYFVPEKSLADFLNTDLPVIAVSFGSQPIPNPTNVFSIIRNGINRYGIKAVICQGFFEFDDDRYNPNIYFGNKIPHEWLLPRVKALIHHGSAGTTAMGMKLAKPMLCFPCMLDQHLWAAHVYRLGLGPAPLKPEKLTSENFETSLENILSNKYDTKCSKIARQLATEYDGALIAAETVMNSVYKARERIGCCAILPQLNAIWQHKKLGFPLSGVAAACLVQHNVLKWSELEVASHSQIDWSNAWSHRKGVPLVAFLFCAGPPLLWYHFAFKGIWSLLALSFLCLAMVLIPATMVRPVHTSLDPAFEARVKRSEYDLSHVSQVLQVGEMRPELFNLDHTLSLGDDIVCAWRSLRAWKFQKLFV